MALLGIKEVSNKSGRDEQISGEDVREINHFGTNGICFSRCLLPFWDERPSFQQESKLVDSPMIDPARKGFRCFTTLVAKYSFGLFQAM